jgi:hypothetical protein
MNIQKLAISALPLLAVSAAMLCLAAPAASAQEQKPDLIANGDFETGDGNGWVESWGKPKSGTAEWLEEGGDHYARLTSTEPGKMVMLYRMVFLKPGVTKLELSCRARVSNLQKGEKPWFDARIMCSFLTGPGGSVVKGAESIILGGNTDGWVDKTVTFSVPPEAKVIQIMPTLFNVQAGQLDFAEISLRQVE